VQPARNHAGTYFGELVPRFARFQILVYDRAANLVVGRGRSIPLRWDGTLADLPSGNDAAGLRAVTEQAAPTAVSALAAEVEGDQPGRGLSRLIIQAMAGGARGAGLDPPIAPRSVRASVGGTSRRKMVSVSAMPSRSEAAAPGWVLSSSRASSVSRPSAFSADSAW
jgi:hypothetical protein